MATSSSNYIICDAALLLPVPFPPKPPLLVLSATSHEIAVHLESYMTLRDNSSHSPFMPTKLKKLLSPPTRRHRDLFLSWPALRLPSSHPLFTSAPLPLW
ncbi:hypothetical protein R3P38DRAFT_3190051 [Favolaschia claudopus]|uniref:Uncharacterized protein n=1 Tax=Favolaschia claudopus TaxID=2862362 RepID=A0AAW0BPH2_9AGAR